MTMAAASLDSLTVGATPTSVTIGQTTTVNLIWTTTVSSDGNVTAPIIASSTSGTYLNGLGGNVTTLSFNYGQTNNLNNAPHLFPESIIISAALSNQADTQGLTTIQYQRSFSLAEGTIPSGTLIATATINLLPAPTPPPALAGTASDPGILNIDRMALKFNDNSSIKLVKPKTVLSAVSEIRYTGTGLFDAIWEVAMPTSTLGNQQIDRLIYTPLRSVRQFLGAGGRIYLQSPILPSDIQGNYILRLRVREPSSLGFTQPVLRYSVNESGDTTVRRDLPPVKVSTPKNNSLLNSDTRFTWQSVRGAKAYQLELYLADDKKPLSSELSQITYDETSIVKKSLATGILVPGKKTSLSIGTLSRQHLRPRENYLWRIIAIGQSGEIISTSPIRIIKTP